MTQLRLNSAASKGVNKIRRKTIINYIAQYKCNRLSFLKNKPEYESFPLSKSHECHKTDFCGLGCVQGLLIVLEVGREEIINALARSTL